MAAEAKLFVPELFSAGYGELLNKDAGVWWTSSGWQIPPSRLLPTAGGKGMRVRAAAGEVEAAQLVIRPTRKLTNLLPHVGALSGPGGGSAKANIEILRVGYVDVIRPTDSTGVTGLWPAPLPPLQGPLELQPDVNQPLWVRVTVPENAAAGPTRQNSA